MDGKFLLATSEHIDELVTLINGAYRGESSKKGWTTEADLLGGIRIDKERIEEIIKSDTEEIQVYIEENKIIGCVYLQRKEDKLYLGTLTVEPEHQAKGIGKKLLKHAEKVAQQKQVGVIEMTVISIRQELINWYERNGYSKTGEKRPFPMNDKRFGEPKTFLEFIVLQKSIIH